MRRLRAGLTIALLAMAIGCAAYKKTPRLEQYDLAQGYRFEQLPLASPTASKNSDEIFVVLAFSGGGTRAAALSYGVLSQLRTVKFHFDPITKAPVDCQPEDSPRCQAMARSLLDEVDVISSVSGGSFTSAYYALNGDEIFKPASKFHQSFLYYPVQRDLLAHAVYHPRNWTRLRSRIEIAADDYSRTIFGAATFADLQRRSRPYLILNATDAATGTRFEFTQEQFDLICGDLSQIPIARGVAASSAFPGLLNSMTIDSFNGSGGCQYTGPGTGTTDWVALAMNDAFTNYRRYNAARQTKALLDPKRTQLHLLDGGLADNIGLRSVLQSLTSTDRPVQRTPGAPPVLGGWSLLSKINNEQVKTIIVITVNARTNRQKDWDQKTTGPGTGSVLNAASGIPMGNYSTETLELLREYGFDAGLNQPGSPRFFGAEVAFENIPDAEEREFLTGMGTNFELTRYEVDCLIDNGERLLRNASSVTDAKSQSFRDFVRLDLKGTISATSTPTQDRSERAGRGLMKRSHSVDIGAQYNMTMPKSDEVGNRKGVGVAMRVTKPNGWGAIVGYGAESFDVSDASSGQSQSFGALRLRTISGGVLYSRRVGGLEASVGLSGGFGFGSFTLEDEARDRFGRSGQFAVTTDANNTWVLKPNVSLWHNLTNQLAATISASYVITRPTVRFGPNSFLPDRKIDASALKLAAGIGWKVF